MVALVLGMFDLSGLKWFEAHMKQDHYGKLMVTTDSNQQVEKEIRSRAMNDGYRVQVTSIAYSELAKQRVLEFQLKWRAPARNKEVPAFVNKLSEDPHVLNVKWESS